VKGVPIDLGQIRQDLYVVGAEQDHIVPWQGAWQISRLANGKTRYVLAASGHIAGVINPPAANKYCYWTRDSLAATPDEWLEGAARYEGSWWPHWGRWVAAFGGKRVPARAPGAGKLPAIEDAPGHYVKERIK